MVESRPQAVDVGCRTQPVQLAIGLLGAHVRRRAESRAGDRLDGPSGGERSKWPRLCGSIAPGLGQSPIHQESLTVAADDDVMRLDVAVQHASAMCVRK